MTAAIITCTHAVVRNGTRSLNRSMHKTWHNGKNTYICSCVSCWRERRKRGRKKDEQEQNRRRETKVSYDHYLLMCSPPLSWEEARTIHSFVKRGKLSEKKEKKRRQVVSWGCLFYCVGKYMGGREGGRGRVSQVNLIAFRVKAFFSLFLWKMILSKFFSFLKKKYLQKKVCKKWEQSHSLSCNALRGQKEEREK